MYIRAYYCLYIHLIYDTIIDNTYRGKYLPVISLSLNHSNIIQRLAVGVMVKVAQEVSTRGGTRALERKAARTEGRPPTSTFATGFGGRMQGLMTKYLHAW